MSVSTETQIANLALALMGEGEIASLDDASDALAVKIQEVFDQNRDYVLEEFPWPSCIKRTSLTFANYIQVTSVTEADPPVVTASTHSFINGDLVTFELMENNGVAGDSMDAKVFQVAAKAADVFSLYQTNGSTVDGSGWGTYDGTGGYAFRYATPDWEYCYALPSDCLKPLHVLDDYWEVQDAANEAYKWQREGDNFYCNVEDASLRYVQQQTTVANFSGALVEAIAYRLAWLTCINVTGDTTMRMWLEREYRRILQKIKGTTESTAQPQGERLWTDAR